MKQILRGVCMIALVALAFTSCKKEDENNAKSFYATAQTMVTEDRAYMEGNMTNFEEGDQMLMYNVNYDDANQTYYGIYFADFDGHTVQYTYSSGNIKNHGIRNANGAFFGFYPAEIVDNGYLHTHANEVMFEIAPIQTYRQKAGYVALPDEAMAMACKVADQDVLMDNEFKFKNIMGVLHLVLKSNTNKVVTSIVYEDAAFNVSGRAHVQIDKVDPNLMLTLLNNYGQPGNDAAIANYITNCGWYVDDAGIGLKGKTMTLDCGEGVQLSKTAKHFYICLRPLAARNGMTITVNFSEGEPYVISTTNPNNMIRPNEMTDMPTLTVG